MGWPSVVAAIIWLAMPVDIRVIHVREFLRARLAGKFDFEATKQALLDISASAPDDDLNVLIDVREAPAYFTFPQVSELAFEFHNLRLAEGRKTGVLTTEDRFDRAHFFAMTARGMGEQVRAFTSFEEAFDWLQG
jgi:hypothetical protein